MNNPFQWIDCHVHTAYSTFDSQCPMDAYLDLVRNGTVQGIGFADHLHPQLEQIAQQYHTDTAPFDGNAYCTQITAAKAQGLNVHTGVEITYEADAHASIMARVAENSYDYLMGSVQSFGGFWVSRDYGRDIKPGWTLEWIINRYYDAIENVLEPRAIDMVAHIEVFSRFWPDDHPLMLSTQALRRARTDRTARLCAESGKIIEVNTSGLFSPARRTMPGPEFLKAYRSYGGERICLSSDAHDVRHLNQGFCQAAELLRSLGYRYLFYPWDKERGVSLNPR